MAEAWRETCKFAAQWARSSKNAASLTGLKRSILAKNGAKMHAENRPFLCRSGYNGLSHRPQAGKASRGAAHRRAQGAGKKHEGRFPRTPKTGLRITQPVFGWSIYVVSPQAISGRGVHLRGRGRPFCSPDRQGEIDRPALVAERGTRCAAARVKSGVSAAPVDHGLVHQRAFLL